MLAVMAMSGKRPEVLVNLTSDYEKIISKLGTVSIKGEQPDIIDSVKIACLGLKSCNEPGMKFRILVFVCSDIVDDTTSNEDLDAITRNYDGLKKFLKKNGYCMDMVCFGVNELTKKVLKDTIESLDGTQKLNRYIDVPNSLHGTMADWLISSPLIMGGDMNDEDGGGHDQGPEVDILKMDPTLLTFEQQIRRAELESMRELRQKEMNDQNRQEQNVHDNSADVEIEIEGVSKQRLNEIIVKNPDDMTEEEIVI